MDLVTCKKCNSQIGEINSVVRIENLIERSWFISLWDTLNNKYIDRELTRKASPFPVYFVVCPTSLDERWEDDIVLMPKTDMFCPHCSISLREAFFLFGRTKSIKK